MSPAVREAIPSLPDLIRGQYWLGLENVEALRQRAIARDLRDGIHERVWSVEPPMNLWRVLLVSLAGFAILFVCLYVYIVMNLNAMAAGAPEAVELRSFAVGAVRMGTIALLGSTAVLALALRVARCFGKAIVGVRTTSAGVTYVVEDGREVFQSWAELVASKRDASRPMKGLVLTGSVSPSGDWMALKRAARSVFGPKRPWKLSRWRKWEHFLGAFIAPTGIALLILIVSILAPDRPVRRGGQPATMPELLQLATAMWLWFFVLMSFVNIFAAGLHRYIQIFNRRFARPKR
ncbi:MAG: hypothetical protein AMXMBFR47_02260 [Planctomycetota bacterium]